MIKIVEDIKFMKSYDFIISVTDTDSTAVSKSDMSPFTLEERKELLTELNDISPDYMEWEDDGYYLACIALRAKNYVLWDGKKKTIRGSAFKTSSKEPILKNLMDEFVDVMLNGNDVIKLKDIYMRYVSEAQNPSNIQEWSSKKTITKAILNCKNDSEARLNERKVYDAINRRTVQEGDKMYVYPAIVGYNVETKQYKNGKVKEKRTPIEVLKHIDDYNNDHDVDKLLERVYDTVKIFANVLDMTNFIDYSKAKNRTLLLKGEENAIMVN